MKVLVTGAAGFLGGRLTRLLCAEGYDVRASGLPSDNTRLIEDLPCEWMPFDLMDPEGAARAVEGVEAAFHVAALVAVRPGIYEAQMKVNVEGTRILVEAAAASGVRRFVHTSTINTLGIPPEGQVGDENTPFNWAPYRMGYMDSKRAAEQVVLSAAEQGALDAVCVLPVTLFGPGDINFSAGTYIREAAKWRLLMAPPGGTTVAHVDDVARGHVDALVRGSPGERYVLGGDHVDYRTLFTWIAHDVGCAAPLGSLPSGFVRGLGLVSDRLRGWFGLPVPFSEGLAVAGCSNLYYDCSRAQKELGYRFRPAREAVREAVKWYREQGMI